ncbi:MAG: methyltransferase domain-containing protein [Acidobacteriota bacterium]|nr:methyltransferase domain-containing protein [Acidobacteriota bacterium]
MPRDLSYDEKLDKLQVRIRAHKLFANFDVSDWIEEFTARAPRRSIFDLGCGDGNHFGIYFRHAETVTGLDREQKLLDAAKSAYPKANLYCGSMDDPLPFADRAFDLCFSNFAIYNARDPRFTISELKRVLQTGGELVLIGPTANNARELFEFDASLTGRPTDAVIFTRADRLRSEIAPIAREILGDYREEVLRSRLTFPTAEEFVKYFRATMLHEKSGIGEQEMLEAVPRDRDIVVSKEMVTIITNNRT